MSIFLEEKKHYNFIRMLWPWKSTKIIDFLPWKHYKHKFRGKKTFPSQTKITNGKSIATELEKQFTNNACQRFAEPEATGEAARAPSQAPWRPDLRKHAELTNRLELGKA